MALAESVLKLAKLLGGGIDPALDWVDSDRCVAISSSLFRSLASVFAGDPPPHDEAGEFSLLMMSPTFLRTLSVDASVPLPLLTVPTEGAPFDSGDRHRDGLGLRLGLRLSGDGKYAGLAATGFAPSSSMRDFLLFGAAVSGVFDVEGVGEAAAAAFSLARNMSHMSCGAM